MAPTGEQFRALSDGFLNLAVDEGALAAANERPYNGVRIVRIAHLVGAGTCGELLAELIVKRFLDDDAGVGHAHLTLMEEDPKATCSYGVVDVGIPQHQERVLAAHLQSEFLEVLRSLNCDLLSDLG